MSKNRKAVPAPTVNLVESTSTQQIKDNLTGDKEQTHTVNSAASQRQLFLQHLRIVEPLTTLQARHKLNLMHPSMDLANKAIRSKQYASETLHLKAIPTVLGSTLCHPANRCCCRKWRWIMPKHVAQSEKVTQANIPYLTKDSRNQQMSKPGYSLEDLQHDCKYHNLTPENQEAITSLFLKWKASQTEDNCYLAESSPLREN